MMQTVVDVKSQHLYDLYYRTRHALLKNTVYSLDFFEWIKAGVAFNVRGTENPDRKISYFAYLYDSFTSGSCDLSRAELATAVCFFYEDLFELYQDHLTAQLKLMQKNANTGSLEPHELILLPDFRSTPVLSTLLETVSIDISSYSCDNLVELRQRMSTIYASPESTVFKCMGIYFDYGVKQVGGGVLLEVH